MSFEERDRDRGRRYGRLSVAAPHCSTRIGALEELYSNNMLGSGKALYGDRILMGERNFLTGINVSVFL